MRGAMIFDLDGTLTDNYPGISACFLHVFERLGAPVPSAPELKSGVGPPIRTTFSRLLGTTEPATIERAVEHYRERYRELGWRENHVYDGIAELLEELARRSIPAFVCTAKPELYAKRIVEHFGLRVLRVYGTQLDPTAHDDKAVLLAELLRVEGLDASACTMIGDRVHDVAAGKKNGTRTIGVTWGYGSREELAEADHCIAHPSELIEGTS